MWMFRREVRKTLTYSVSQLSKKQWKSYPWVLEECTTSHFISTTWDFLLHITSNARVSADSVFLKFFLCLLVPAPLAITTLFSYLSQVCCASRIGGEPWRSFSLETLCRILQKAGAEITLATLLSRSDLVRRTVFSLACWDHVLPLSSSSHSSAGCSDTSTKRARGVS